MKAKFLFIAAATSLLASCSMDLDPAGTLNDKDAIESVNDAAAFRNGFYSTIRSFSSSQFFSISDIQADMFNGLVMNGNRLGPIANGNVIPSESDITSYWASLYGAIANTNYFLPLAENLYQKAMDANDLISAAKYSRFIGEAHFFRGYYYAMMFDRFCPVYDKAHGDEEGLGLPIVTVWSPSPDRKTYPGRSSANATIKFIKEELQLALTALSEYEESGVDESDADAVNELNDEVLAPNAPYLSSWAVRAMQARFALMIGEYQDALEVAKDVISSPIYKLAGTDNYANMWKTDHSTEIIFEPIVEIQELANSIGSTWISSSGNAADYIPTPSVIAQYASAGTNPVTRKWNDVRYSAFINNWTLQTAFGKIEAPCFVKFPGTTEFDNQDIRLMNRPKVFRLSEMYFIAMESAYELNLESEANTYLSKYLTNRIIGYKHNDLSGTALRDRIRKERGLEFIGEGFRISDLRRWKQGFSRETENVYSDKYPKVSSLLTLAGLQVTYQTDDHRYTWPIPSDEIQSNPQIRNQQNPGY